MILFNSPTSPYGRATRLVALELGLPVEEEVIDISAAVFLDSHNPLRQIPTLLPHDGRAIYDSRVICAYLDGDVSGASYRSDP